MPSEYFAVPVFSDGWNESPSPSMEPGPFGNEMVFGETPLLSAHNPFPHHASTVTSPRAHTNCFPARERNLVAHFLC